MNCLLTLLLMADPASGADSGAAAPTIDPRTAIETAVPDMIRMLERKEYAKFVRTYAEPKSVAELIENGKFDEIVERFGASKHPAILVRVLKQVRRGTPKLEKEGGQATFDVNVDGFPPKSVTFQKVDGKWYLAN